MALSISVIVGCMGRKVEAEQFIPVTSAQLGVADEIVLVDWDDPEHVAEWAVGLADPKLTIVRFAPARWFEPNHQRNLGCRNAAGDVLIVSDIDMLMPDALIEECRGLGEEEYLVQRSDCGSFGWLCCRWAHWRAVNGYEEALSGYGHDDFYHRETLNQFGLKMRVSDLRVTAVPREVGCRAYPDDKRVVSHHVNLRIGKALRIYGPYLGNYARNFGWGGVVIQESEARKHADQARFSVSAAWWSR